MCTRKFSFVIVFFFKIAFILIELHLFEAYSIGNYTLLDYQGAGKFDSESEGETGKNLKRVHAFTKLAKST